MEHDQRVCPRCGAPTGDYGFCPPCRAHIESLTGTPTRAAVQPADADQTLQAPEETVRLKQALVRLEQAMSAASRLSSDRIGGSAPAGALEVDGGSPADNDNPSEAGTGLVEIAKLPSPDEPGSELHSPPRDVARLEDVLTVASPRSQEVVADKPASVPPPTVAPANPPEPAPLPAAAPREPSYVDAQALREAFWFEQALARQASPEGDSSSRQEPMPVEAQPAPAAAPFIHADVTAVVEPEVARVWSEEPSSKSWGTTMVLLALIALVVFLTGRSPRRLGGHRAR